MRIARENAKSSESSVLTKIRGESTPTGLSIVVTSKMPSEYK
jgi:hypothetical protein